MANIRSMVVRNSGRLNNSERQIIQFILSNPAACRKLSLSQLAKKLYVSQSAIFRLCKKLGLSGYSELRFKLDELIETKKESAQVVTSFNIDLSNALRDVLKYFRGLDLSQLFHEMQISDHIYIYSTGWQQELLARYLSHELFIVGKTATVLPAALGELKAADSFAKPNDILFVISYTGDNRELNTELSQLELTNDKFKYVSFTNMKQNKLASLAQFNFYYPTIAYTQDQDYIDGKVAFSPAYYLIDLLIGGYTAWQKDNGKEESNASSK